ncbi:MAG: IS110 family transposase [Thermoplasmata archaeon]
MATPSSAPPTELPFCVGMDVHQKTTTMAILDPGGKLLEKGTIPTSLKALDAWHRHLTELTGSHPTLLGLEASTAGQAVFRHLRQLGRDVHMAHPRKLKDLLGETKTDKNDALALATVLRLGSFPEVYVPADDIISLRTLVRLREEVVDKLRRCKVQVRPLLVKNHLYHEAAKYEDIFGEQALRWLKATELADEWDQKQLALLLEEGELHTRQVHALTTELAKVGVRTDEVRLLQSIPGIDYVLALCIIAEVGDIRRFRNRKKFAAYCGLVPKNHDSGERTAKHAPLRHGNPRLKWALSMAVSVIRHSRKGKFYVQLKRFEARVGMAKAMSAVAHRLAFTIYGLWKMRHLYEEVPLSRYATKRRGMQRRSEEASEIPAIHPTIDRLIRTSRNAGAVS